MNHASGTFDMRYMGGLRRYMPATYLLVVIAALSLIGIVPLAGFWSKDEILLAAFDGNSHFADWINVVAFVGLLAGVVLTAFYTVRMVMLTFYGDFRGGVVQEQAELHPEAHVEDADTTAHADVHDDGEDAGRSSWARRRASGGVPGGDGRPDGGVGIGGSSYRICDKPAVD